MTRLSVEIPVIETERLILREPRETDLEPLTAFLASERARFVGGPMTRFEAGRSLISTLGHWMLHGFGFWTVTDKQTGAPLGRVGFLYPVGWPEPELGWQLFEDAEGRGIAFEAVTAARRVGAAKLGLDGVFSYIAHDNSRSRALAERLGAVLESEGDIMGTPAHIFRHPRRSEAA